MIVLDTHALVWMIEGEERQGNAARDLIEAARTTNGAVVPAICA